MRATDSNDPVAPRLISLPSIADPFGDLTFADGGANSPIPFAVSRVYWVTGIPEPAVRGNHAHRRNDEVLVAVAGAFTVTLEDQAGNQISFRLSRPDQGLYVPPMHWRTIDSYAQNSTCLVLASEPYCEDDYIRSKKEFQLPDGQRQ